MYVLGISAFFHDSSAAVLKDGVIVAAMQEERLSHVKNDKSFPILSIQSCLDLLELDIHDIDLVVFHEKPFWKFERIMYTVVRSMPFGFTQFIQIILNWIPKRLNTKYEIRKKLGTKKEIIFADHHMSHAASAFYNSGFDQTAILIMDAVGEFATTSIGFTKGNKIIFIRQIHFPHSLGLLYSAFTQYCGFKVNSGEYKLMGIAAYGNPRYKSMIYDHLIRVFPDGSFELNLQYFSFTEGHQMINKKFCDLFGQPARLPESDLTSFYSDIAASIQTVLEEIAIQQVHYCRQMTGLKNIVFAGGVFLNCRMNQKIAEQQIFDRHYFYSCPGDAGTSIGAAYLGYFDYLQNERIHPVHRTSYLGCRLIQSKSPTDLETKLNFWNISYAKISDGFHSIAKLLAEGKIIGWADGALEMGARALGHRSILADPRNPAMKDILNKKIKRREEFRPFAPVILDQYVHSYYKLNNANYDSMMVTANANSNAILNMPSVVHLDGTSRIQVLSEDQNPSLYSLLRAFHSMTDCPALINTSFNLRGEPMTAKLEDCLHTFLYSEIDALVLNSSYLILKSSDLTFVKLQIKENVYPAD